MTHTLYMVMMVLNGVPQQAPDTTTYPTIAKCNAMVEMEAASDFDRAYFYCQPVEASITLPK